VLLPALSHLGHLQAGSLSQSGALRAWSFERRSSHRGSFLRETVGHQEALEPVYERDPSVHDSVERVVAMSAPAMSLLPKDA
jgi:hypothetical protein